LKRTKGRAAEPAGAAAALPEQALRDRYAGHGGSYIFDPASGLRMPVTEHIERATAQGESNE
jgi:hypothetical protein